MNSIRRIVVATLLEGLLFVESVHATSPATTGQVLCASNFVFVGEVQNATITGQHYDAKGDLTLTIKEVLTNKVGSEYALRIGNDLVVEIGNYDITTGSTNNSNVENLYKGKTFVFALHAKHFESLSGKPLFDATMWPLEERDEAVYLFAFRDKLPATLDAQSKDMQCGSRSFNPCADDQTGKNVDELYALFSAFNASKFTHTCYANALAAKGLNALPVLIRALESNDADLIEHAISALSRIGPSTSAALPALCKVIENPKIPNGGGAYSLIDSYGDKAKPAIPILINLSNDKDKGTPAIFSLGYLAKYDPEATIPQLISLLKKKINPVNVARALYIARSTARPALLEIKNQIDVAIEEKNKVLLNQLIEAYSAIEDDDKAIPVLIKMLNTPIAVGSIANSIMEMGPKAGKQAESALLAELNDPKIDSDEIYLVARTLNRMGNHSRAISDALFVNYTKRDDYGSLIELSSIDPLPVDYVEKLNIAIKQRPGDGWLCRAIANTHTPADQSCLTN